jgi:hypothetical protein
VIGGPIESDSERFGRVPSGWRIRRRSADLCLGLLGVQYQVRDVSSSVAFYTQKLGFNLDQQSLPAFAQVSVGNLKLILRRDTCRGWDCLGGCRLGRRVGLLYQGRRGAGVSPHHRHT